MDVRNVKITPDDFQQERERILASWPTGKEGDLEEAVQYSRNLPHDKHSVKPCDFSNYAIPSK